MNKNNMMRKNAFLAIIVLIVGAGVVPSMSGVITTVVDIEPLDVHIRINGVMGDNGWFVSCVTITITANGNISYIMYKINDEVWEKYVSPITFCEDGYHIIYAYSVDPHGNQSNAQAEFKIDHTSPSIWLTTEKIDFNTWLIIADVSDETSGVNRVEFYVNGEYIGSVTEYPYEWIYNATYSTGFSVKGLILNPEFTEETVSFFAVMAVGRHWCSNPDCPSVCAIVFDNAGNLKMNPIPCYPINTNFHFYIFKQLTFPNEYSGYIGKLFINACFEDFPSLA